MSTHSLKPWTDSVKLHPDVEEGRLTEAVFAIDLGGIAQGNKEIPIVNRDPEAFFRATYLTTDLRRLLEEALASLAGKPGFNRVLKLRTPFGGGKSHTLACLLHAARNRDTLNVIPETKGFADPGEVKVAVFDGEKFDARDGKVVGQASSLSTHRQDACATRIRTMWGWLAWQIDPEKAFPLVAGHDADMVAPSGDVIADLLTKGAGGRPVLLLLDEVLKYMERASAVPVHDSTLQRQAKDFFQNLTVEVSNSKNAMLVYSLQWSQREALGNVALLEEIDHLASRVDQLREPVTGDEVLYILQRRLLGGSPDATMVGEVSEAFSEVITGAKRAYAQTESERANAEEEGIALRDRMKIAYPFHPAIIDVMTERWTSISSFQRTRGALRFLATCLKNVKDDRFGRSVLGVGDVPLHIPEVRVRMLKELGAQNEYDPVLTADIVGAGARSKRIDDRLAREIPAMASVQPARTLATAIFLYSFGGLKRDLSAVTGTAQAGGEKEGDALPPGVTENELLDACVSPELDSVTARSVLADLRNACLYLHYDGVRYCFKKDPNVTKLIEDAEQDVARKPDEVRDRVKEMLESRVSGHHEAMVWPCQERPIPDKEPLFLIGYLPLEFAGLSKVERENAAKELFSKFGDGLRRYKNGLALAIPEKKQIEALRRAVRYLMAIQKVESKKNQLRLSKDQLDQLRERRKTEEAATESAFRGLYASAWLPRVEGGQIEIEKVEIGGRGLQATGVHERIMELLTGSGTPKVHGTLHPRKIVERLRLGEAPSEGEHPRLGCSASEALETFFRDLMPPRLTKAAVVRKAIAKGVSEGLFGYASGTVPQLGPDGKYQVSPHRVAFSKPIADDEVDVDSGFILLPQAIRESEPTDGPAPGTPPGGTPPGPGAPPTPPGGPQPPEGQPTPPAGPVTESDKSVHLRFQATRDQVFKAFPAIANLAEKSDDGKVIISIDATSADGYDKSWLRNAVQEPLEEADIEGEV